MTEHGAQYDHIGSQYDEYARTATLKRAESYTFFRMVGMGITTGQKSGQTQRFENRPGCHVDARMLCSRRKNDQKRHREL